MADTVNVSEAEKIDSSNKPLSPSYVNLFRISACCERLNMHVRASPNNDPLEFFNLCLSLARGIDYAVANREVPSKVRELPFLLKQVCKLKQDRYLQAALLVLMISVKNACRSGWFSDDPSTELRILADEILSNFCSTMDFNTESSTFKSTISTIMSRYYPRMKMGEILAFLEVKPGYGTYVHDFQITKDIKSSRGERIRLFVAQPDNLETSSCLITPTQGNFILNGKGVKGRSNNNFMDTGPQIPTPVNHFLKYGTNLLQALGQFDGHYIIVIAFMSISSTPDHSTIQDYVQPTISMTDPDSELVEGASRVSLSCPISFKRIDVPAKGHMCKHRQCFDYYNYMEINSRRPSWRCPHCNQHVCFTDLRIDQNVVKVLMENGKTVSDVMISSDGSWKAIMDSDNQCDKSQDKNPISLPTEVVELEENPDDAMGLTVDDYDMDTWEITGIEDRKVSPVDAQNDANVQNMAENYPVSNINELNQHTATPIEDDFWSGFSLPTCFSEAPSSQLVSEIGVSEPSFNNWVSPVLTDTSTPVPNREAEPFRGNAQDVTSLSDNQICTSNSLQLQQSQHGNSALGNEYGHMSSVPTHIRRAPIAVQALAVPSPTTPHQQGPLNRSMIENRPSVAPQTSVVSPIEDTITPVHNNTDRQKQFPGVHHNPHRTNMASSRLQHYSNPQPMINMRPGMNQSAGMIRPSSTSSPPRLYQGGPPTSGVVGSQQARVQAAQRASMMPRPVNTSRAPSHYPMNTNELSTVDGSQRESSPSQPSLGDVPMDATAEQNWRPSGRMRGSLSGRAYSDALDHYIIRPTQQPQVATQQGQTAAPISRMNTQNCSSPGYELFLTNRAALNEAGNHPRTGSANTTGARSHWPSHPKDPSHPNSIGRNVG